MKQKIRKLALRYGIMTAVGLLLMWFVLWANEYNMITDEAQRLKVLADSMTVPGMILILVGLLVKFSAFGALDGLGFLFGGLFRRVFPGGRNQDSDKEGYYEYVQRKRAKRKGSIAEFFVVGAVFMVIAVIQIIRFYQVY